MVGSTGCMEGRKDLSGILKIGILELFSLMESQPVMLGYNEDHHLIQYIK
jgi:hypothetical protein